MARSRVPTPAELGHWLAAAAVMSASGTYRFDGDADGGFDWVGAQPVMPRLQQGVELRFWTRGTQQWRLEQDGLLLAVTDGRRALAQEDGDWVRASSLAAPLGPAGLLRPEPPSRVSSRDEAWQPDDWAVDGEVEQTEQAGRRAWRWTRPDETWVVDHETGVALLHEDDRRRRVLLELVVHDDLPDDLFSLPDDLLAASRTPRMLLAPEFEAELGPERAARMVAEGEAAAARAVDGAHHVGPQPEGRDADDPTDDIAWHDPREPDNEPSFVVPWWPRGGGSEVVSGDPSLPEVLLLLTAMDGPEVHLGITRAGRTAPVRAGRSVHRWDGDGWSFALSYRGPADPELLARVAGSVPARWELS